MRISGLASGIDTDSIVKQLMEAHRIPRTRLVQQKQLLEWQRDDYRNINSKILEFRNLMFDMKLNSTYAQKTATVSDDSNLSVSAGTSAQIGTYQLKVTQLAEGAMIISDEVGSGDRSETLTELNSSFTSDAKITITGEKGSVEIDVSSTDTIQQLVEKINDNSSQTGVTVNYNEEMKRFFFTSSSIGEDARITLESDSAELLNTLGLTSGSGQTVTGSKELEYDSEIGHDGTFTIHYDGADYDFNVTSTTTVEQLIEEINAKLSGIPEEGDGVGIIAALDENGNLEFYNPDKTKPLTFSDNTGNDDIVKALGLDTLTTNDVVAHERGQNAKVEFNGIPASYDSNNFTINGITINAKAVQTTEVNITVTQDTEAVIDKIKTFVEKYNELIELINGEVSEKRYYDYDPLTAEQKEEMTEEEIELWEEKARSGMLRGDTTLVSAISSFRISLSSEVEDLPEGDIKHLSQIGITTGTWAEKGKLYIDENKLRDALINNPDEVKALFTTDDGDDSTDDGDGLAVRLYEQADKIIDTLTEKAGKEGSANDSFSIGKRLDSIIDEISELDLRLIEIETRYYNQFTAMETYINQMNSQSAWLTQQFSM